MRGWIWMGAAAAVGGTLAAFRASAEERRRTMPGDELVPDPMSVTTQGVTIGAPPERVWPWLAQMGGGRAGWYSYDRIDNDGHPSATTILPEYQRVAPGDVFPALPGATDAFIVAAVEPPRSLVLIVPAKGGGVVVTWQFLLEPRAGGRTRLLVRNRVSPRWREMIATAPAPSSGGARFIDHVYGVLGRLPAPLMMAVGGFGHRVMQNAQLRGLKRRAEPIPRP